MSRRYVAVAVPVPLHRAFTYAVPQGSSVRPGCRVRVPFQRRSLVGLVIDGPGDSPPEGLDPRRVRSVTEVLDAEPLINGQLMALAAWLARYYHATPGAAYLLPVPSGFLGGRSGRPAPPTRRTVLSARRLRDPEPTERIGASMDRALSWLATVPEASASDVREATGVATDALRRLARRGLIALDTREVARDPFAALVVERDEPPPLTPEQAAAVARVEAKLGGFAGVLLHGVTGSGKTEVYLRLIDAVLARGQTALVLVPEIALTPQLVARFRARLGDRVAVQHSGLGAAARHEQWERIRDGELPVVIGARSALFAPLANLGLIVVDEEHEGSFKQETAPRYHARDLALVRGRLAGAPVVLGSATPSLESWANSLSGKLERVTMGHRVEGRPMPGVELVDLRSAPLAASPHGERIFSQALLDAVVRNAERGEQSLLFVNRRGFASVVLCRACGETLSCPSCSVTYTWHRRRERLVCHYCQRVEALPARCPACGDDALQEVGFGTERVVDALGSAAPDLRVGRMDRDTTRGRALTDLLTRFRAGKLDALVGTQMLAKGHDFPRVTLVGVLLAEQSLRLPDLRASERTFQLLTQIAGRAGRAQRPGRVLVQTFLPEHYALQYATRHDAAGFLTEELRRRRDRGLPPWTHLALLRVDSPRTDRAEGAAYDLARALRPLSGPSLVVRGPLPAPIERVNDRFRYQVLVYATDRAQRRRALDVLMAHLDQDDLPRDVHVVLDVDPYSFL